MSNAPSWVTLTEDEAVVWQSPPSLLPYLAGMVGSLVAVVVGVVVLVVSTGIVSLGVAAALPVAVPGVVGLVAGGFLVAVGAIGVTRDLLRWRSNHYVVTTEEVYRKQGLFSRTVTNLRIDSIENTAFSQSAVGRLFSYGDVRVTTAGTDQADVVFENVSHPDEVVARITERLDGR